MTINKKSFFWGILTGIILTLFGLFVIGKVYQNFGVTARIKYLEKPVSYENKKKTSFEVFQVLGKAALATEASDKFLHDVFYNGNTVLILGEDFYSDQIVTVENPQRIGTYSYTNNAGIPMTVPVINGKMK